ncbi:MAG TPA: DUF1015 domain-containing protein [Clostridia bacterium]|nr:DUF1015 domain-containing protein [Clostridia bacterium]
MADIRPFRALRYDSTRVRLEDVLTQPYDKISSAMQDEYYRRSPHNLIRFELARPEPGAPPESIYPQSSAFLNAVQRQGVLRYDETPGLYAYRQRYRHPLLPTEELERTGIVAIGRLYDYDDGVVFRHEQTLSGPKADRMHLLRHTRTHSGQIFMLYEDPTCAIDAQSREATEGRAPDAAVTDEYGVENLLWRISDAPTIAALTSAFGDKKLIIADGHHRYETARSYRDAQREAGVSGPAAHDYAMMTLINMEAPGLIVLPTHRVVSGLTEFRWPRVRARLEDYFQVVPISGTHEQMCQWLRAEREMCVFVVATRQGNFLLRAREERIAPALASLSAVERKVDVTVLHELVFHRVLGISEDDLREQRHVRYYREADKALRELEAGANAVFLLNPVPLPVLRDVCYAGRVMPQKSTDFYPKLLSGLTLYSLDESFDSALPATTR